MAPRPSTIYLATTALLALTMAGMFLHASGEVRESRPILDRTRSVAHQLELTDLCLFTEASYTRHLAMTDFSAPFQDAPMSLEHFPTGGLVAPPAHLTGKNGVRSD